MKTIIAGGRNLPRNSDTVRKAVDKSGFDISEVVCGCCNGIDRAGMDWARLQLLEAGRVVTVTFFPAWHDSYDWAEEGNRRRSETIHYPPGGYKAGRGSGPLRNAAMAEYADALIAIWDGKSRGTAGMIDIARKRGLRVFIMAV